MNSIDKLESIEFETEEETVEGLILLGFSVKVAEKVADNYSMPLPLLQAVQAARNYEK